jgi:DivIVA domain-containing protein
MIDLTPLDVRNKRGDFKKLMRGYDPHEVDVFLELAAERLEALVRENMHLKQQTQTLQERVTTQSDREQAVQDALVTAQELRADIRAQSQREAGHVMKEAEAEARRITTEAEAEVRRMIVEAESEVRSRLRGIERQLDHAGDSIEELERRRVRFLKEFRGLLERELDVVEVEEDRVPFQDRAIDLELGSTRNAKGRSRAAARSDVPPPSVDDAGADGVEPPDFETSGPTDEAAADDEASSVAGPSVTDEARRGAPRRTAPPPAVDDEPSSLELELMAGAEKGRGSDLAPGRFEGIPDLETVLAEAGIEEVKPPESDEIAPPPPLRRRESGLVFLDPEDEEL